MCGASVPLANSYLVQVSATAAYLSLHYVAAGSGYLVSYAVDDLDVVL